MLETTFATEEGSVRVVDCIDDRLVAISGPDSLHLRTPVPTRGEGLSAVAEFAVGAGDRIPFVLTWHPSHESAPRHVDAEEALADTTAWWTEWSNRCTTDAGSHRDLVVRSLITLKALTYAPTGGLVAAPTTSLPEEIGGVRNWDYRYCWLRDATFSLYDLMLGGYDAEAVAWRTGSSAPPPARRTSCRSCTAQQGSVACPR